LISTSLISIDSIVPTVKSSSLLTHIVPVFGLKTRWNILRSLVLTGNPAHLRASLHCEQLITHKVVGVHLLVHSQIYLGGSHRWSNY
jgi:hypothetical protein